MQTFFGDIVFSPINTCNSNKVTLNNLQKIAQDNTQRSGKTTYVLTEKDDKGEVKHKIGAIIGNPTLAEVKLQLYQTEQQDEEECTPLVDASGQEIREIRELGCVFFLKTSSTAADTFNVEGTASPSENQATSTQVISSAASNKQNLSQPPVVAIESPQKQGYTRVSNDEELNCPLTELISAEEQEVIIFQAAEELPKFTD